MRNCKDSNCAKWFINPVGKIQLTGNVIKGGTTLCPLCVADMAKDMAEAVKKQESKAKATKKKA